jgi:hypothetical protein
VGGNGEQMGAIPSARRAAGELYEGLMDERRRLDLTRPALTSVLTSRETPKVVVQD